MAALTFYLTNTAVNGYGELNENAPASALSSPVTGWIVAKTASGNYSAFLVNTERAANTFGATVLPAAASLNADGLRTASAYTGTFANANWTFTFEITATTSASGQDGNFGLRLYRSANADGSSATEITAARQETNAVTNLATGATTELAVTFNPGAFSVNGEYLFVQLAWEITGASGNNGADVNLRIGSNETRIVSADFTPSFTGSGDGALSTVAGSGTGTESFPGSGSGALDPIAGSGTGAEEFPGSGSGAVSSFAGSGTGESMNAVISPLSNPVPTIAPLSLIPPAKNRFVQPPRWSSSSVSRSVITPFS